MKLTVKEYASRFNVSVQSVYQRLKKGTLKSVEENGTKYVIVDTKEVKEVKQPTEQVFESFIQEELKSLLKQLEKKDEKILDLEDENKKLHKEIKKLNKKLIKSIENEKQTLLNFIGEMKRIAAPANDVIDLEEVKPKKKKKKNKKGKK